MKIPTISLPGARRHRRAAFTLAEMMVSVGIFVLGMSIAYPFLITQLNLYVRNFSINKSNNSSRHSLQLLKRDVDMSLEPPTLASYTFNGGVPSLTPLPDSTVSADAIIVYVNFGPAYNMPSLLQDHKSSITNPALGITLVGRFITATGTDQQKGLPAAGDRLLILSPSATSAAMLDKVTVAGVTYTKPGRKITGATLISNSAASGCRFLVTLDQTTPLPGNGTPANPYPAGDQSVYLFHESAYMTNTLNDATGAAVEKQLLYVENTANLTNPTLLIRDLDADPKEIVAGAVAKPFNYYQGRGPFSALAVNLPVRAFDYAHVIAERGVAAGQVNVVSEFNVFIRSNPSMPVKSRFY